MSRRLMRGDPAEILARIDEEAACFAERLRSAEAQAAFAPSWRVRPDRLKNSRNLPGRATMSLQGRTLFITGGSRGIGLAIALRARATAPTW